MIFVLVGALAGVGTTTAWAATRYRWGADLARDPAYQSGRASRCEPPALAGTRRPAPADAAADRAASRGLERSRVYSFDTAGLSGGRIFVCSEYGRVRLRGIDGDRGRISVSVLNPYPDGERAVHDTAYTVDVREEEGKLVVGVWHATQGFTAFRSWMARGIRAAAFNVDVELPRRHLYDLRVVANHDRVDVTNLDVRGSIEGYGSPGADLDVRLGGPFRVHLDGREYDVARFPEDEMLIDARTGISARVEALTPATLEVRSEEAEVQVTIVDSPSALRVDAVGVNGAVQPLRQARRRTAPAS